MNAVDSLARCQDFAVAERHTLEQLARDMSLREYEAGEVVFHQEDSPDHAYLIESGGFRLSSAASDGTRRFLVDMRESQLLGEMSTVVQCPRSATATALGPSSAWEIPEASLRTALENDPRLSYTMLKRVMKLTMDEDTEAAMKVGLTTDQQLASMILELHEREPAGAIAIGQADIAVRIGVTPMEVILALGRLQKGGIVENASGALTVLNPERLRMLAEPGVGRSGS
jgi:CRP/FNR family transcriptional regulator, cyclic AMP receptor protein